MANVKYLRERAELLRQTRDHFDRRGFLEVQPPCLSRDCVVDAYLDPLTIGSEQLGISDPRLPERFFLQTSPESAMKRMLAAGAPSIYSIGPVFRAGEAGQLHNLEFAMLEWYEVGGDLGSAIELTVGLVRDVLAVGTPHVVSYREAFREHAGFDPFELPLPALVARAAAIDRELAASIGSDRDSLLDVILSSQVMPRLGSGTPVVLTDYPLSQAALAKPSPRDPQCAARFELFVEGIELANGYDELLDADVLLERAAENNRRRQQHRRPPLQVETTLVRAMRRGLPACSGVALGLDRLLMLRVGERSLPAVLPFTITDA
jgi:lysyl-tRNA synthetase class 2